jgi:hypothetical protein
MQVHAYTSKHIPAFVTAPDRIYQSNATSRTDFAQRSMAGMLPTDCR